MRTPPIAARLAVYLLLAAEDYGNSEGSPEVMLMAATIAGKLSEAEFQKYADDYADSRVRWELSRAVTATHAN